MKFILLFVESLILCACTAARRAHPIRFHEPNKYLIKRNFVTGSFHYKNLSRITEPQPVRRLRLMVTLNEAAGSSVGFIEVFRIKVRWVGPELWWDNLQSAENNRYYELRCELEDENDGLPQTFRKLNVDASISGYDENFLVRQPFPLLLRCRMRSVNGAGLFSRWIWTNTVKLYKLDQHHHHQTAAVEEQQQRRRQRLLLWRRPPMPIATYLSSESARDDDASSEQIAQDEEDAAAASPLAATAAERFAMDTPPTRRAQDVQLMGSRKIPTTQGVLRHPQQQQQQLRMPHWELLNRRNTAAAAAATVGGADVSVETEKSPPSPPAPFLPYFLRPPIEFS